MAEAAPSLRPAFEELIRQGAQGDVVYNDDTPNRILERMGKRLDKAEAKNGTGTRIARGLGTEVTLGRDLGRSGRRIKRSPAQAFSAEVG